MHKSYPVKLWHFGGKVAFWFGWPFLRLYLLRSERTRIVVVCGEDVLVVRGWLSNGKWGLPGGGLHRGEKAAAGAVRELREETGIEVNASELQKLYSGDIKTEAGLRYKVHAFGIRLDKKPELVKQRFELTHLSWISKDKLLAEPHAVGDVHGLIKAFYGKMKPD